MLLLLLHHFSEFAKSSVFSVLLPGFAGPSLHATDLRRSTAESGFHTGLPDRLNAGFMTRMQTDMNRVQCIGNCRNRDTLFA